MTILLHGFWGQPADFNSLVAALPLGAALRIPDLYEPGELSPATSLQIWPEKFWQWVDREAVEPAIDVVGYSMGGRLALSAICAKPKRIRRALILSANPVLNRATLAGREVFEEQWAAKFLKEDWSKLESEWQEQPVFTGSAGLGRRRTAALREVLGLSLTNWSPRLHGFSVADVKALPTTVEWAFGALDQKYLEVAKSLQELPVQGQISIIPNSGHRLITDASGWIADWIKRGQ